jgi:hypothetical protein
VLFKGEVLPGGQPAILDPDLFYAVQTKLQNQRTHHSVARDKTAALLCGHIYDDRGNDQLASAEGYEATKEAAMEAFARSWYRGA